ncbi:hemerythrin domain-containing protein [Legionella gresilensis]|uniref:hemerythrin domain-containing protein n=1 Tax=Legionella gresilensis TaxID=91823 RepID=UPI001041B7AD|nr:hemerythrin domain-containing protein [Legionella gresilensis]
MNAIDFLIQEHNKVRSLFKDLNDPSHREETQKKLFLTIRDELIRHEEMEQQIWYPQLKSNKQWNEEIRHLISEEHSAKKFIDKLNKMNDTENWREGLKQLQEDVEHHAHEEETKLFPQVKRIMDDEELTRIGKEMKKFKDTYH